MKPITAKFGDAERTFRIHRKQIGLFETAMGRSLYAILREFIDQQWRLDDVARVISFALHGPDAAARSAFNLTVAVAKHGLQGPSVNLTPHPEVVGILTKDGHGNYADLAANILSAAIFGDAVTEEKPDPEAEVADAA